MTDIRHWRQFERHPLSAEYPDIKGKAWRDYVQNLKAHGIVNGRRVTLHEGMVIDGWQLYRACLEADVKPEFKDVQLHGMTLAQWVETVNDHRRHETQEAAQARIDARRQRVAKARAEGQSTRTIAEAEGVSQKTVLNDLSTDEGSSVDPPEGKITGKDGKKRSATTNTPKDTELPRSVQNALADTWHLDSARTLAKIRTQCKKAFNWSVYLDHGVLEHLKLAEEYFLAAVPKKACKSCKGTKRIDGQMCMDCKGSGYTSA